MKTLSIVSALVALGTFSASAQPATPQRPTGQVTIRAVADTVRPEKKRQEKTDEKKDEPKAETVIKTLSITLSGAKTVTGPMKVVTTFYGRDAKSKDTVADKKLESEVTLDASQTAKITTEEVTFTATAAHTKKDADGKPQKVDAAGKNYYGWVVRVFQEDKLLGEAASAPPLLKITE